MTTAAHDKIAEGLKEALTMAQMKARIAELEAENESLKEDASASDWWQARALENTARALENMGRILGFEEAAEPLIKRADRWQHAKDDARLSVPLYELRALARAALGKEKA